MLSPVLSLTPCNLTTALLDKGGLLSLFESIQTPESKKPAVKLVSLNMVPDSESMLLVNLLILVLNFKCYCFCALIYTLGPF